MEVSKPANPKVIFALLMVHFCGDFYAAFINPLLPALADKLSLSLAEVGFVRSVTWLLAFIIQPLVGYLADRYHTRFFLLGGPVLAALFIPLIGVAPTYSVLLLFVSVGYLGVAMFHPQAAGMVPTYAGRHVGLAMGLFWIGGAVAFGIGPVASAAFVAVFSLSALPYTAILGLACLLPLFFIVPVPEGEGLKKSGFIGSIKEILGDVWRPIVLIYILIVIRSLVTQSYMTFLPMLYAQEGYSLIFIGWMLSLFNVVGSLGGVLAGHLSDRIGYKPIFYVSFALSTPSLFLFLYFSGTWIYGAACLAGFMLMATYPLGLALAQEIAPKGKSLVSSLMMGLAWGIGGFLAPAVGKLGDIFGIREVLWVIAFFPLACILLIRRLPEPRRGRI